MTYSIQIKARFKATQLSEEQIHLLSNKNIQDIVALLRPTLDSQYQEQADESIILKSDTFDITIN